MIPGDASRPALPIRRYILPAEEGVSIFLWLAVPILLATAALALTYAIAASLGASHTYVLLYPAVVISALIGGYRAGLIASLVSVCGDFWLFDQLGGAGSIVYTGSFVFACLLIVGICYNLSLYFRRTVQARSEAHNALQSEQLFRSSIEYAPAALAMFDKRMRYIGASRRWMQEYGTGEIQGKSYDDHASAFPQGWEEARLKALQGEISHRSEYLIEHPDGREQWLRWSIRPWDDVSGALGGIVVFSEDITSQKHDAISTAEGEVRLRAIIESVEGAMIVTDSQGDIESFNSATIALFGYTGAELRESNVSQLIGSPPTEGEPPAKGPDFAANESGDNNREVEGRRKGGEVFLVDQMITKWSDIYGEKHWTLILRDISERRAGEEELARAWRMEALGRLAGGIAHDFNNLLSVITGNLELAEPQIVHTKARTMIQKALMASERGAGFTQQLLTLARKRQSEFEEVNINRHVSGIAILLEHTLGSNVHLRTSLAPDLWITRADPVEIDSAIINLAMNAGDAMPGGGTLSISTSNVTIDRKQRGAKAAVPSGDFVCLTVRDSGTGMTGAVRRHAFEPFFTTKEQGKGTGLGLSGVYSFAQAAGGFITLDSAVGTGTTVEMYIPRWTGPEQDTSAVAVKTPQKRGRGEVILVVEDDQEVREVSIERLKRLGYATRSAGSVSEACQVLREDKDIALVFSDIVLTGMKTGYDLARWVKRNRPELNVLLTTGYDVGDKELVREKADPLVGRLHKPHSMTQLANEIRKALDAGPPGGG